MSARGIGGVACKIYSPFTPRELKSKGLSTLQPGDARVRVSNRYRANLLQIVLNERYARIRAGARNYANGCHRESSRLPQLINERPLWLSLTPRILEK